MVNKFEVIDIIKKVVDEEGYDFIDAECSLKGKNPVIRVYADRVGGITIQECTSLSRRLGDYFDREDAIAGNYRLEVSSPGIDRPLKSERDFRRNIGRGVAVTVRSGEGMQEIVGEIRSTEPVLVLLGEEGEEKKIPYESIVKGKIRIQW